MKNNIKKRQKSVFQFFLLKLIDKYESAWVEQSALIMFVLSFWTLLSGIFCCIQKEEISWLFKDVTS